MPEATAILICDYRKNHRSGSRSVLFRGGHVERVGEADVRALIKRPPAAAFAAALRTAEGL